MKLRARLGLGAVAGLLLLGLMPSSAIATAATAATTSPSDRGTDTRYLYRATFKAKVDHQLHLDYGNGNYDLREMIISLEGSLKQVQLSGNDPYSMVQRGGGGAVRVTSAEVATTETTDDGGFRQECDGKQGTAQGQPFIRSAGRQLWMFAGLVLPTTCTDSEGGGGSGVYHLPTIVAYRWSTTGAPGDKTITYKISGDAKDPEGPFDCPTEDEEHLASCGYLVQGTMTLTLVKELGSKGSKIASVTPQADRATVKVVCPARCTIEIRIKPLEGGGQTVAVEKVSPEPGKPTNVSVPIPRQKRKLVKESGGVRIQLSYVIAGGAKLTETRDARL